MPWFVVTNAFDPADSERIWTVSRDQHEPGWDHGDGWGTPHGLTKADAQFLCDAANEKENAALLNYGEQTIG